MVNVMISFAGDPAVIFFSFVPIRLRISFSLFLLLPAILHGTLAKHNSIFSQSFSDIFGGYYFLFPKRSQSVSEKSFPLSGRINRLYRNAQEAALWERKKEIFLGFPLQSMKKKQRIWDADLTLPTAKAGGFLFLPPLHWRLPYGTAMSYTVSTSYIYTVPVCPTVQLFIFMQTASAVLFSEY